MEQNNYLPFGTRLPLTDPAYDFGNRWRYAAKEEQRFGPADLGLLDFGARMYDPFTSRWTAVDPMADEYLTITPFAFCLNSPILFQDPDGNDIVINGTEGSSITVETEQINWTCSLDVDWGGSFSFNGDEALSAVLDIIGLFDQSGISDVLNAKLQYSDGRYLDACISGLSAIPVVGDLAKFTRLKKDANILGEIFDSIISANRIKYLRQKSVRDAWKAERELVINTGKGTRKWTNAEMQELIQTGKVKGYEGHHINNVKHHPELAGEQRNVEFVKQGNNHLEKHGGNYRNETHGPLISR